MTHMIPWCLMSRIYVFIPVLFKEIILLMISLTFEVYIYVITTIFIVTVIIRNERMIKDIIERS